MMRLEARKKQHKNSKTQLESLLLFYSFLVIVCSKSVKDLINSLQPHKFLLINS